MTADELKRKLLSGIDRVLSLARFILHEEDRRLVLTMRGYIATADPATMEQILTHYPSE